MIRSWNIMYTGMIHYWIYNIFNHTRYLIIQPNLLDIQVTDILYTYKISVIPLHLFIRDFTYLIVLSKWQSNVLISLFNYVWMYIYIYSFWMTQRRHGGASVQAPLAAAAPVLAEAIFWSRRCLRGDSVSWLAVPSYDQWWMGGIHQWWMGGQWRMGGRHGRPRIYCGHTRTTSPWDFGWWRRETRPRW